MDIALPAMKKMAVVCCISCHRELVPVQENQLYPQIAERDEKEGCTANWLLKLHENASEFNDWETAPLNSVMPKSYQVMPVQSVNRECSACNPKCSRSCPLLDILFNYAVDFVFLEHNAQIHTL